MNSRPYDPRIINGNLGQLPDRHIHPNVNIKETFYLGNINSICTTKRRNQQHILGSKVFFSVKGKPFFLPLSIHILFF